LRDKMKKTSEPAGRIFICSLGCDKNLVDSEVLLGMAERLGWRHTAEPQEADVLLVNTCGFIDKAKEESIETILEVSQYKKDENAKLVVSGCLSQRYHADLGAELPEVDYFLGTGDFDKLASILNGHSQDADLVGKPGFLLSSKTPRLVSTPPYSAFVKISEGCSSACSYCIIPQLRGPQKSRDISDVIEEVENLLDAGVKELNIIGQNVSTYGDDLKDGTTLQKLLERPELAQGRHWVRLLYLYPNRINRELLEAIARSSAILPYFDIPLQHIDSRILKAMGRKDTEESTQAVLKSIREVVPKAVIRTSLIVGFPGETDAEFEKLLSFVKEGHFDRMGAFTYSQEDGTRAAKLPEQIPDEVKQERYERIMEAQQKVSRERLQAVRGSVLDVLVEGVSDESEFLLSGRYWGQAPEVDGVTYLLEGDAESGDIVPVRIKDSHDYDLFGKILKRKPKGHNKGPDCFLK